MSSQFRHTKPSPNVIVVLTDFRVVPMSTPTRSQLLTGRGALANGAMFYLTERARLTASGYPCEDGKIEPVGPPESNRYRRVRPSVEASEPMKRSILICASLVFSITGALMAQPAAGAELTNPTTMLSLNSRMARDTPEQIHPELADMLGHLVSSGNSSQEAFFRAENVPSRFRDSDRIRYWDDELIDRWARFLISNRIELVPSVNMYEPVHDQIAGWRRFVDKGVTINRILFGGEYYLRQWFDGRPGNGMMGQVRIDRTLDRRFPPDSDVRYYVDMLDEFLPAFREAFPDAALYIVACTIREGGGPYQEYRRFWRDRVVAYARENPHLVDGFRFHIYVGQHEMVLDREEQIERLESVEAQIASLLLPIYVAEGGQRDAYWNDAGLDRLQTYVETIGTHLRSRNDGSIQGFHVAFGTWSHHRFPFGHPYALATTEDQMHHYFSHRYQAGSDRVVLTPIGEWFVQHWRTR